MVVYLLQVNEILVYLIIETEFALGLACSRLLVDDIIAFFFSFIVVFFQNIRMKWILH